MDAFKSYFLQNYPHTFISEDPHPALLLWSNTSSLPRITGISIVEQDGIGSGQGIPSGTILAVLKSLCGAQVPIASILYAQDLSYLKIDGKRFSPEDSAENISQIFKVPRGKNPVKPPNDPKQIKDAFHIWSRGAFDGTNAKKTDVDIIALDTKHKTIIGFVEIKRSSKISVGNWKPYKEDLNNYLICMAFSNLIRANFFTVHHEIMGLGTLKPSTYVDLFMHKAGSAKLPTSTEFYTLRGSGKVITVRDALIEITS